MEKVLLFANMQEKKEGRGEDSDPILYSNNDSIFLGVFDGMGGAGSTECASDFSHNGIDMTMAYIGSRIIRDAIEKSIHQNPKVLLEPNLINILVEIIKERYSIEKEKYPHQSRSSSLRSSLIKEYPTTLAIANIRICNSNYIIDSYWAGDSRNYLWTAEGLFQITLDDLKGNYDPLENLHEDAPLSNCIQANAPFNLNHKKIILNGTQKFVVISATDGCFGYFPSPMDLEKALSDSLSSSQTIEEWNNNLSMAFSEVTADDFSFSIATVGFRNFTEVKSLLGKPNKLVKDYFYKRRYFEQELKKSEEKITRLRLNIERTLEDLWPKYKTSYLKFMTKDEER